MSQFSCDGATLHICTCDFLGQVNILAITDANCQDFAPKFAQRENGGIIGNSQTGELISSCRAMRRLIKSWLTGLIKDHRAGTHVVSIRMQSTEQIYYDHCVDSTGNVGKRARSSGVFYE